MKGCWTKNKLYDYETGTQLIGNPDDMKRSSSRIIDPATKKPVKEWCKATDTQKRLVIYHKTFFHLYGVGQRGIRVKLPSCIVTRIKRKYKNANETENEGEIDPSEFTT